VDKIPRAARRAALPRQREDLVDGKMRAAHFSINQILKASAAGASTRKDWERDTPIMKGSEK